MFGIENVIEYIEENSNCKLISKEYKNAKTKILIQCECGEIINSTYDNFKIKKIKKCNKCISKIVSKRVSLTIEYVNQYVNENSNCKLISKEYISSDKKLKYLCSCGNKFEMAFDVFRTSDYKQCQICSSKQRADKQRFTIEKVREIISEKDCTLISKEYINYSQKLDIMCKCGEVYQTTLRLFLSMNKNTCFSCSMARIKEERKHSYNYVNKYINKYECKWVGGEYLNSFAKIEIECKCGEVFITDFATFRNSKNRSGKTRCDKCSQSISRGEYHTSKALEELGIEYKREYRFKDCKYKSQLPFDFYIPSKNICIEYQGEQHFNEPRDKHFKRTLEQQKMYDDIKRKYCKENGIKLIEIPYWTSNLNIKRFIINRLEK